jgi:hypothetical protein
MLLLKEALLLLLKEEVVLLLLLLPLPMFLALLFGDNAEESSGEEQLAALEDPNAVLKVNGMLSVFLQQSERLLNSMITCRFQITALNMLLY